MIKSPRRVLCSVAVASCLPYLGLKVAWISGSHVGIPSGSPLLEHRARMAAVNSLTVLMDAAVILLAVLLTRPWGLRVPAWTLVFPVWVATGLLVPIMTGFPLHLLLRGLDGTVSEPSGSGSEPFLHAWVFGVVYTGFIVQGLALGTLFLLYARDRWGHVWRGRMGELPDESGASARQTGAVTACVLALFPLVTHMMWACGSTAGLNAGRVADRDTDFYVLEATFVCFALAAVLGACLLAFRRARRVPVAAALALAWVGSGVLACWGGWLVLASLTAVADSADRPTTLMHLTYAGQMLVGFLVAALVARFAAGRSAGSSTGASAGVSAGRATEDLATKRAA
ncbi:hypothetical protein NGF19_26825 [Streptomyces sp. RY43-2]|uniref:LigA n=1 Tax=Streptomyces macrolidinus TaxID=2952607 RepID=A0ABT0ZLB8_9ACTN|nr:hypothetical protein [Streptomyces macrolidinus]MCN9244356.1 hypothetical protein [Streptomyces macrolidinus]